MGGSDPGASGESPGVHSPEVKSVMCDWASKSMIQEKHMIAELRPDLLVFVGAFVLPSFLPVSTLEVLSHRTPSFSSLSGSCLLRVDCREKTWSGPVHPSGGTVDAFIGRSLFVSWRNHLPAPLCAASVSLASLGTH